MASSVSPESVSRGLGHFEQRLLPPKAVGSERISCSFSRSISPDSFRSTTIKLAPVLSHSCCQGTKFEWCSSMLTTILSPAFILPSIPSATLFIASVAPLVNTIELELSAPMNRVTFSRASSKSVVDFCESEWTPLCTFALDVW